MSVSTSVQPLRSVSFARCPCADHTLAFEYGRERNDNGEKVYGLQGSRDLPVVLADPIRCRVFSSAHDGADRQL